MTHPTDLPVALPIAIAIALVVLVLAPWLGGGVAEACTRTSSAAVGAAADVPGDGGCE